MTCYELWDLIANIVMTVLTAVMSILTYLTIKTTKNIQEENFQVGLFNIRTEIYSSFDKLCRVAKFLANSEEFHFDAACIHVFKIVEGERNATNIDIIYESHRNKAMLAEVSFSEDVYADIAPLCLQLERVKQNYNQVLLSDKAWSETRELINSLNPSLESVEQNQTLAKMRDEMKVLLDRELQYLNQQHKNKR